MLAHGDHRVGKAEIPTRLAAEPLGDTPLDLWSSAEGPGSGSDIEEEILFCNKGLAWP